MDMSELDEDVVTYDDLVGATIETECDPVDIGVLMVRQTERVRHSYGDSDPDYTNEEVTRPVTGFEITGDGIVFTLGDPL